MAEQSSEAPDPSHAATPTASDLQTPPLHVADGRDVADDRDWDDRLHEILARGDLRDQAAERRGAAADRRDLDAPGPAAFIPSGRAGVDREWAGRDRDDAAVDRSDLIALWGERHAVAPSTEPGDADS